MPKGVARDPSKRNQWGLAASRIGCSLEDYTRRRELGYRWCYACRSWKHRDRFGSDKARRDGVDGTCIACRQGLDQLRPHTASEGVHDAV